MEDRNDSSGADNGVQVAEEEISSMNSNSTLEIVLDGSEILGEETGRQDLELSIAFDKVEGAEDIQSDLPDRLNGVEFLVSLRGTQPVGVEIVSSGHGNRQLSQPVGFQLELEGPERDSWALNTETNTDNACDTVAPTRALPASDLGNEVFEQKEVIQKCSEGENSHSTEKKRQRDDMAAETRCLKAKTDDCKEQADLSVSLEGYIVPATSEVLVNSALKSQEGESRLKGSAASQVENKMTGSHMEEVSDNIMISNAGGDACKNEMIDEAKGVCAGQDVGGPQCENESTEVASLHDELKKEGCMDEAGRSRPRKRRKIAMLLAYCGAGYQGMQKNPGAVTIEGSLEEALSKAGAMPENYNGNPRRVDWMRAARTDKGVSAVGQVVSGLFYIDPPGFVERVNTHLPKQIRLLGYKRVTPTFNAKNLCDRRRYEYIIPAFALDPGRHRDREFVLASEGKEDAFVRCQECSERGRKIPAGKVLCKQFSNGTETEVCAGERAALASFSHPSSEKATLSTTIVEPSDKILNDVEPETQVASANTDFTSCNKHELKQGSVVLSSDAKQEPFHIGDVECAKLNRILSHYVGTHNFHNFTSRVKAEDPSAKRYVVSFQVGDVFTARNTEFLRCIVVGQSFMLHQIRKMIGLAIAVFRGFAPESIIERALRRDTNITIPTAPELGLFLDECMYPAYNQKWFATHEEVSQKGHEKEIDVFKQSVIYEHIAVAEDKEGQMALFLHSLNDRNYADLASAREAAANVVTS